MARNLMSEATRRHKEAAHAVARRVHERLAQGGWDAPIRLWDGTELGPADSTYRIRINQPWSLRSLLLARSDRAVGEAYLHDDIDVEGSMVAALLDASTHRHLISPVEAARIAPGVARLPRPPRRSPDRGIHLRGRRHTLRRDAQAVRFHYDVGNDFYGLFLDSRLVYSCAYFDAADLAHDPDGPVARDAALDRAQLRKLDLICRKLDLRPGERFLDIGCGWGSLVMHAVEHFGVHALGVTLSEQQAELGRKRIADAGLGDGAEIRVADYREVTDRFDAIASVGMVEHVGAGRLAGYFRHLWGLTAPGGRVLNHGITTGKRGIVRDMSKDRNSFVGAYVFPDGALVPASTSVELLESAGFELLDVEQLRPHYTRTLSHWVDRLERHADQARALAGELVYRTWRAYMAGSAAGFEHGDLGVAQILGGRDAQLPLGRAHQLPALPAR